MDKYSHQTIEDMKQKMRIYHNEWRLYYGENCVGKYVTTNGG